MKFTITVGLSQIVKDLKYHGKEDGQLFSHSVVPTLIDLLLHGLCWEVGRRWWNEADVTPNLKEVGGDVNIE